MVRSLKQERLGLIKKNTYGSVMEIIEYKDSKNITVRFEQGYIVNVQWHKFCDGEVRNVYDKSIFGIGYIGDGKYKPSLNNKDTHQYRKWYGMLERCYDPKCHEKQPTYKGCSVAEEWHNFQHFAAWYDENYYELNGQRMELDKDILVKGNKIYSPETCVFVPQKINALFTKNDVNRGELPIGVNKSGNNYRARCMDGNGDDKRVSLGNFKTPVEAFMAYKLHKEKYLKEIAEKFKDVIPTKLYDALLNYEVSIND
jgi:hypothetical protein